MKNKLTGFVMILGLLAACRQESQVPLLTGKVYEGGAPGVRLRLLTSDSLLAQSFSWAAARAMSYVHNGSDPVGLWYEAALPGRQAFCMRDVAHMSTGAHLLGLAGHNKNMLRRFAANIAESRDWCSYWEINKNDRPAPADYRNDREFWYNLPANYDVLDACYRQYLWTADPDYLEDEVFENFYARTLEDYTERWQLGPGIIMQRDRWVNAPQPLDSSDYFHICRGLPGYEEGNPLKLLLGADLPAFQYKALQARMAMLRLTGRSSAADVLSLWARQLRQLFDTLWWNDSNGQYYQALLADTGFVSRPTPFILYSGIVSRPERIATEASRLEGLSEVNIETQSYLPLLLARHDRNLAAYRHILDLSRPGKERREYPEVSFTLIEAVVSGLAGVEADARNRVIKTLNRLPDSRAGLALQDIPVFGGGISLVHYSARSSELHNRTGKSLRWKPAFYGHHAYVYINGEPVKAVTGHTPGGRPVTWVDIRIQDMEIIKAEVPE